MGVTAITVIDVIVHSRKKARQLSAKSFLNGFRTVDRIVGSDRENSVDRRENPETEVARKTRSLPPPVLTSP